MSLSTHVLDATTGRPASGMRVHLATFTITQDRLPLHSADTDADGRVTGLPASAPGIYELSFDTGGYFAKHDVATFYPEVVVRFEITDPAAHHHVPLLLSPFAYSTYRGS
jgi:5-hydroxyisourate hydrolase